MSTYPKTLVALGQGILKKAILKSIQIIFIINHTLKYYIAKKTHYLSIWNYR